MLTFNPGPSKLSETTKQNIIRATQSNVLEISHRSQEFSQVSKNAIEGLREFFKVPDDYKIFYTASATEAMQLSILNCCEQNSFHFVNGNFSNLFWKISKALGRKAASQEAEWGESCDYNAKIPRKGDFITITNNETSTGCAVNLEEIKKVRQANPNAILAVDITSSAGAAPIEIKEADIWLFSVQKCFGLPAGLGVMIVSPKAFEKSLSIKNNFSGVYSLESMWRKMEGKYQTVSTPNVLNIFLLGKILKEWNDNRGLEENIKKTEEKYKIIEDLILNNEKLDFFVKKEADRSKTVICIEAQVEQIQKIHEKAAKESIVIGKGYGKLKPNTFRIANFPAISKSDLEKLINIF